MKQAITNNTILGSDPELQFHLAIDASEIVVGGCLFQLRDVPPYTEAEPKF